MNWLMWIIIGIAVILLLIIFGIYNSLIKLRNRISNALAQIDVQLKRRYDLIPNLVETVKGYARYERSVLENVTKARTALMGAKSLPDKAKANNQITAALKTLFAVAENYPQLKANENFMQLQEELSGTESKIAYSRQFYNDSVLGFNNKIQMFPSNIIAKMFNFKQGEFFKTETEEEKKPVKVKFDNL